MFPTFSYMINRPFVLRGIKANAATPSKKKLRDSVCLDNLMIRLSTPLCNG